MKSQSVTIQMKATKQYSPVVLIIMLCKVTLTYESVDEIPKCDHSNIVLSNMILTFESADQILQCEYSNESY